jgi:hypothetical protein
VRSPGRLRSVVASFAGHYAPPCMWKCPSNLIHEDESLLLFILRIIAVTMFFVNSAEMAFGCPVLGRCFHLVFRGAKALIYTRRREFYRGGDNLNHEEKAKPNRNKCSV